MFVVTNLVCWFDLHLKTETISYIKLIIILHHNWNSEEFITITQLQFLKHFFQHWMLQRKTEISSWIWFICCIWQHTILSLNLFCLIWNNCSQSLFCGIISEIKQLYNWFSLCVKKVVIIFIYAEFTVVICMRIFVNFQSLNRSLNLKLTYY